MRNLIIAAALAAATPALAEEHTVYESNRVIVVLHTGQIDGCEIAVSRPGADGLIIRTWEDGDHWLGFYLRQQTPGIVPRDFHFAIDGQRHTITVEYGDQWDTGAWVTEQWVPADRMIRYVEQMAGGREITIDWNTGRTSVIHLEDFREGLPHYAACLKGLTSDPA